MSYGCSTCGFTAPKWMGFCPQCRSESALEADAATLSGGRASGSKSAAVTTLLSASATETRRTKFGIDEFDRVLGGGIVPGAVVLVGGEPGVGKSTLLLQAAGSLAATGETVLLASAEESAEQVAMRARRLGIESESILLTSERDVDAIIGAASSTPGLLIVDSIQTVAAAEVGGAPGGVAQVRESAARLIHSAKESGVPVVLVGHVTKDGAIAGPKLLEHAVDVVLYLEGDPERGLRVLRCLKNRFGPTHQIGLFEMTELGMTEVSDPSGRLLDRWRGGVPGSVVFPVMDGRRTLLVEVQALVTRTTTPQPRRSVRGIESARLHQVLAVLERHAGHGFGGFEVYVNVIGGIQVKEPAVDLALAVALVSSLLDTPLEPIAAWGEIGLTGEVRPVAYSDRRRDEAARLGIDRMVAPNGSSLDRINAALVMAGLGPGR